MLHGTAAARTAVCSAPTIVVTVQTWVGVTAQRPRMTSLSRRSRRGGRGCRGEEAHLEHAPLEVHADPHVEQVEPVVGQGVPRLEGGLLGAEDQDGRVDPGGAAHPGELVGVGHTEAKVGVDGDVGLGVDSEADELARRRHCRGAVTGAVRDAADHTRRPFRLPVGTDEDGEAGPAELRQRLSRTRSSRRELLLPAAGRARDEASLGRQQSRGGRTPVRRYTDGSGRQDLLDHLSVRATTASQEPADAPHL
jgi:hypothetical protein